MSNDIQDVLKSINSRYGDNSVVALSDKPVENIDVISSGSMTLDRALGVGGFPRGRIVEVFGSESSGKTTICIETMVEAQKLGHFVAFVDMEQAFDLNYAVALGLDMKRVAFSQPSSAEEAMAIVEMLIESGKFAVVVLDSVAALVPKAEIDGDMGDSHIGLVARLMGQALRKISPTVRKTNTLFMLINQLRANVNTFGYGSPTITTGGNAIKFYASIRLDMRRKGGVKGKANEADIGNVVIVKVKKNKVAAPFKECDLEVLFGAGFCPAQEAINIATKSGIIKQGGAWYTYGEHKVQGKEAMRQYLLENDDILQEIKGQIVG